MLDFTLWIISPDKQLSEHWQRIFSREHMRVVLLDTMLQLDEASKESKGLALVKIGLSNLKTAQELKDFVNSHSNVSIIVFNEQRKVNDAQISSFLEFGADDFILSEINENVLLSKIRAHLRRLLPTLSYVKTVILSKNKDLELNKATKTVNTRLKSKKAKVVSDLTTKEFDILTMLICNEEEIVTRVQILECIWGKKAEEVNSETIDKHIEMLRRKLGAYGKNIKTVYGDGYAYKSKTRE